MWSVKCEMRSEKCGLWSVKCEVRSVDCEVWSVDCEVWSADCEVWSVKCGLWSVQCEVWSEKCEVRSVKEAVRSEKCEVWTVKCGVWSAKWEVWSVKCEVWSVKEAVRSEKCEMWSVKCEMRSEKCGLWSVKCEMWTVKCEVWSVDCEVWSVQCEVWSVRFGVWRKQWEVRSVECEVWSVKFEVWSAKSAVCSVRCGVSREGHGRDRVSLNYRSFMFGKLPPPACPGLCYTSLEVHGSCEGNSQNRDLDWLIQQDSPRAMTAQDLNTSKLGSKGFQASQVAAALAYFSLFPWLSAASNTPSDSRTISLDLGSPPMGWMAESAGSSLLTVTQSHGYGLLKRKQLSGLPIIVRKLMWKQFHCMSCSRRWKVRLNQESKINLSNQSHSVPPKETQK